MGRGDYPRVPMDQCIPRRLYKLRSRNLTFGVYDGSEGFEGIRWKFTSSFLATEYHWDQGPPWGTVSGVEDTGVDLPDHIQLGTQELYDWLMENGGDPTLDPGKVGNKSIKDFLRKKEKDTDPSP